MEAKAHLKYVRISPRKVQIVLDLIRGKDTETAMAILKNTNKMLVETLDEVVKIQNDGRQKRREAELELGRIEGELKQKLLEIRG